MTKAFWIGAVATTAICGLGVALLRPHPVEAGAAKAPAPTLPVPQNYREWTYLTSGLDMTYTAPTNATPPPNHDGQFDNVFVNPEAYRTFTQTGTWPNETVFVLENRAAKQDVSINKAGRTQGAVITGIELHVKSGGQWAFYARRDDGREHLIQKPASCYTCHEAHAIVDTTFVQFYPTLLPIAIANGTLSPNASGELGAASDR